MGIISKKKSREVKNIRYLVSSLDDLKDIVDTVSHILKNSCQKSSIAGAESRISTEAVPLNSAMNSMILNLKMPLEYMRSSKTESKANQ